VVASDFRVAETDSTLLYLSAVTHLGEGELPFNLVAAWEMTGTESRRVFVGSHPRPWVPTHVAGLARDTYTPSQPAETELAPLAPAPSTAPSGEQTCIEWAEDADRAFNVAYFRPGDTTLTKASTESLKENVNRIGTCPAWCVKVRGQSIPIEEDGLARAAARADAVRTFYARQDVEPGRVLGMATVADVYDPYRIHSEPTTSRSDLRVTTEFWPCPAPTE
jgi:outer membrane protein OmpA-like peptidoglycan-associated protein